MSKKKTLSKRVEEIENFINGLRYDKAYDLYRKKKE